MKKTAISIVMAIAIICSGVKPAEALIIDPAKILAKVSDFVEKVSDGINRITQQINQVKLMASQGYDLTSLKKMGKRYYRRNQRFLTQKMFKLVKGTKEKQKEVLEKDADIYKEASSKQAEEKLETVKENKEFLNEDLNSVRSELSAKAAECPGLKAEYEGMERGSSERAKKWNEYTKCMADKQLLESNVQELQAMITQMNDLEIKLQADLEEKQAGDEAYKEKKRRVEELEAQTDGEDNELIDASGQVGGDDEWDTFGPDKIATNFTPSEGDYQAFMRRYFYDPDELTSTDKQYEFQSNMNRILRERRYLFINTAIHLMQVVTSIRREIPVHTRTMYKMANQTDIEENELAAMSAYAATKVENAKVLLLYAQLLSAKLQYLAARDLLMADLKKEYDERDNFIDFDLGQYLLDSDYIVNMIEEAKSTIDTSEIDN